MPNKSKTRKRERLNRRVRLTEEEDRFLSAVSRWAGVSLGTWMRESALAAAERIAAQQRQQQTEALRREAEGTETEMQSEAEVPAEEQDGGQDETGGSGTEMVETIREEAEKGNEITIP